jgi:hypothetical protein
MKKSVRGIAIALGALALVAAACSSTRARPLAAAARSRIQIALLLDTSAGMTDVVDHAKTLLSTVVDTYRRAERDGEPAIVDIALYEYGGSRTAAESGYVDQILPFTADADRVLEQLWYLTAGRGDGKTYCGAVIESASEDLAWSKKPGDLRLLFLAGSGPFDQGPAGYRAAIAAARARGIRIHTIHFGSDDAGWRDGAERGGGEYLSIPLEQLRDPPALTEQDPEMQQLLVEHAATRVPYTECGRALADGSPAADRPMGCASYDHTWDLVHDADSESFDWASLPAADLPQELRALDVEGRKAYVARKRAERQRIAERMGELTNRREQLRRAEHDRQDAPLEAAIIRICRDLGVHEGFRFEASPSRPVR